MEIVDLRYLVACAEAGRFAIAARVLDIDTSTVSRRIASLEDELGLSLFEREHSGIRLTKGGHDVLDGARRVLSEIDAITLKGRQHGSGAIGEVRLGIRNAPVAGVARELIASWRVANPDVTLTVTEGNQHELALGLSERRLDVALVTGHNAWAHVAALPIFRETMFAAIPESHELACRSGLRWASIRGETILVQGWNDNQTQREFYATLLGGDARFQAHAASKEAILALVGIGVGIALTTESQAELKYPGVAFKPIDEENACLDFGLVWLPETEDPVVGRFVAFMRDESRARNLI
jgi:DNA-binding transcriptional LysR family regulator